MPFPRWEHIYENQLSTSARRAAQKEMEARNESLNFHSQQSKAIDQAELEKLWAAQREADKRNREAARKKARRDAHERAQRDSKEFFARLKDFKGPDDVLLDLLEIRSHNPTLKELRSCYLEAIRKHHPDAGGSEEMAKKINAAYEILSKKINKQSPRQRSPR